jgi:hypothetical protein
VISFQNENQKKRTKDEKFSLEYNAHVNKKKMKNFK